MMIPIILQTKGLLIIWLTLHLPLGLPRVVGLHLCTSFFRYDSFLYLKPAVFSLLQGAHMMFDTPLIRFSILLLSFLFVTKSYPFVFFVTIFAVVAFPTLLLFNPYFQLGCESKDFLLLLRRVFPLAFSNKWLILIVGHGHDFVFCDVMTFFVVILLLSDVKILMTYLGLQDIFWAIPL